MEFVYHAEMVSEIAVRQVAERFAVNEVVAESPHIIACRIRRPARQHTSAYVSIRQRTQRHLG